MAFFSLLPFELQALVVRHMTRESVRAVRLTCKALCQEVARQSKLESKITDVDAGLVQALLKFKSLFRVIPFLNHRDPTDWHLTMTGSTLDRVLVNGVEINTNIIVELLGFLNDDGQPMGTWIGRFICSGLPGFTVNVIDRPSVVVYNIVDNARNVGQHDRFSQYIFSSDITKISSFNEARFYADRGDFLNFFSPPDFFGIIDIPHQELPQMDQEWYDDLKDFYHRADSHPGSSTGSILRSWICLHTHGGKFKARSMVWFRSTMVV